MKDLFTITVNSSFFVGFVFVFSFSLGLFCFFFSYERAYSALYQAGPDKGVVVTELPDTSHRCLVRGKGPKANPAALSQLLCLSLRSELHFVSFL